MEHFYESLCLNMANDKKKTFSVKQNAPLSLQNFISPHSLNVPPNKHYLYKNQIISTCSYELN